MVGQVLYAALGAGFALLFGALGYWVGCRRTTRRHLPALLYAAHRPTQVHLGNTVARQPQRPDGEGPTPRR